MTARWSIAQACMWIGTRDAALAKGLNRRSTILEAGFTVFEGDLTLEQSRALEAGARDANIDDQTLDGMGRRKLVWDARHELLGALCSNKLIAIGRANGVGDTVQINPDLWPGLALYDEPGRRPGCGVVARPEDRLNSSATWFDEVSLAAADVQHIWPYDGSANDTASPATAQQSPLNGEQQAKPGKTKRAPRKAGPKRFQRTAVLDYLNAQYPAGVPDEVSVEAIRTALKAQGKAVSPRTIRRAMGRK
jgi:hypothetical protein